MGIGSILNFWSTRKRQFKRTIHDILGSNRGLAIWGSGVILNQRLHLPKLEILALRGPLTAKALEYTGNCVFGDPVILAPYLMPPKSVKFSVGIVPHYSDKFHEAIEPFKSDPNYKIIDVEAPWKYVLENITSCEVILSSSLHGLIIADAYGKPNQRISLSKNLTGGDFKFNDYGLSVGRDSIPAKVIENQYDLKAAAKQLLERPQLAEKENVVSSQNGLISSIEKWASKRTVN